MYGYVGNAPTILYDFSGFAGCKPQQAPGTVGGLQQDECFPDANMKNDPEAGRYTQTDPIGFEGSKYLYIYVNSSPVFYIDPSGLETCILVTRVHGFIHDHASLYLSQGGEDGGQAIYDPSGSYVRYVMKNEGDYTYDIVEGKYASIDLYTNFHNNNDKSVVIKECVNTTKEEE